MSAIAMAARELSPFIYLRQQLSATWCQLRTARRNVDREKLTWRFTVLAPESQVMSIGEDAVKIIGKPRDSVKVLAERRRIISARR